MLYAIFYWAQMTNKINYSYFFTWVLESLHDAKLFACFRVLVETFRPGFLDVSDFILSVSVTLCFSVLR